VTGIKRFNGLAWVLAGFLALVAPNIGCDGSQGPVGAEGEKGTDGQDGVDGKDGVGKDGKDGVDGKDGTDGSSEGTLSGKVTNSLTKAALSGVEITLSPAVTGVTLKTDSAGAFTGKVPIGSYKLTYELTGYTDGTANVVVIAGTTTTADLALAPEDKVSVSIAVTGTKEPGKDVTLTATATAYDGSTVSGYAWSITDGTTATAKGTQKTAAETYTMGSEADYKAELIKALTIQDRIQVLGINPLALEEAETTAFEVEVTTSSGKYTAEVDVVVPLDFAAVSTGLQNVPIDVPLMLAGKKGVTWAWKITTKPTGSTAALSDASSQNPYFTPDVEGKYVIEPGDVLLGMWRHAQSRVEITLERGRIVKIEGGSDAYLLESYLERAGDDGAFRLAHAGWGTDERAEWGHVGMDSESKYGTVLVALGRNTFRTPAAYSGLGGENRSVAHFDICCRNTSLYLDGELIIENERFVVPELG